MKPLRLCLPVLLILALPVMAQQRTATRFDVNSLKHDIDVLCQDAWKGRNTPSPGLDSAAAYISQRFQEAGLKPLQGDSFLVPFELTRGTLDDGNAMSLTLNGKTVTCRIKFDFVPHPYSGPGQVEAPVVFVGYGITAPEYNYDDYAGIDVTGAIVCFFTEEPQADDSSSVFNGIKRSDYWPVKDKLANARTHGAVGAIVVSSPLNNRFRRPPNTWPSLMRHPIYEALPFRPESLYKSTLPTVLLGRQAVETHLGGMGIDLKALQQKIDESLTPQSRPLEGMTAALTCQFRQESTHVNNVVGCLPGRDGTKAAILFGGHYDHLGAQGDSSIYYGADDNASGTAAVIALGEAFAKSGGTEAPLCFAAWAGEEKGLFGATHFADDESSWPESGIAAYINLDMVGRIDSAKVHISGTETAESLESMVETAFSGLGLNYINKRKVNRSDHVPFYEKRIPVLGLSTGFHDDYHMTTDTPDKIDHQGMALICEALFNLVMAIDSMPGALIFQEDPDSPLGGSRLF